MSKTVKDALAGEGSTIANASFSGPSGTTFIKGCNRNESAGIANANFSLGADNELRENKESNLCSEAGFQYSGQDKRSSGHAESRIVEQIFSADPKPASGTLLVNVSLRKRNNQLGEQVISKQPCGHCHRLLCAAKKCGIKVFICDANEQQQELTDDMCQEHSNEPVTRGKRRRLIETIDPTLKIDPSKN